MALPALPPERESPPEDPRSLPNPITFAIRRFTLYWPGPRPKFLERIRSPGVGLGSSRPYDVGTSPGLFGSVAIPGRALNNVSPYGSLPLVISNGAPDCITTKGLMRTAHLRLIDPPIVAR